MIKPDYYHQGNVDVIKFGEENFSEEELKGFYRMNVLKYVTRFDRKNGLQDLEKAKFYLDKLVDMNEEQVPADEISIDYGNPATENELNYFLRSLSDMPKQDKWVDRLVPGMKVSTYYAGTNPLD